MTLRTNTFENGTAAGGDGTAISAANSGSLSGDAFDAVSGTIAYDNAQAYNGTYSALVVTGAAVSLRWTGMTTNTIRASVYFKQSAGQSGTREMIQVRTGAGTQIANIGLNSSNQVVALHNGGSTIVSGSASGTITNNNWYRIDAIFFVNTGNAAQGRILYRVCDVNAGDTNTAWATYDSGNTLTMGTTNLGSLYLGLPSDTSLTGSWWLDSVRCDDTASSTTFLDGLYVSADITETVTPALALLEASGGAAPYTIAQDSGTTYTPIELDDGTVSGTGKWLVAQHASDVRVYTVTDDNSVESAQYSVQPISPANTQLMRPDGGGSSTSWL